jgi:hypothetical protein
LGGANDMASVDVRLRPEHYDSNPRWCFGPERALDISLPAYVEGTDAQSSPFEQRC